jgi:hypothetical protein
MTSSGSVATCTSPKCFLHVAALENPDWCFAGQSADMNVSRLRRQPIPHSPGASKPGDAVVTRDINVLALVKGEERYIFLFDDNNRAEALRTLGRFASNPELSFTWYDAAVLSQKIRKIAPAKPAESSRFTLSLPTDELGK